MKSRPRPRIRRGERGVATVVFVIMVPVLLAFFGLAIDLARTYARQGELQAIADAIALTAAAKLDGTRDGITDAYNAVDDMRNASRYDMGNPKLRIDPGGSPLALSFANSPTSDAVWHTYSSLMDDQNIDVSDLLYVRVDMSQFKSGSTDTAGDVGLIFATLLPGVGTKLHVAPQAVAGKLVSPLTPLAVCNKDFGPIGSPFDLLTDGAEEASTHGKSWLVNPIDAVHSTDFNSTGHFDSSYMQASVCSGTVGLGQVKNRDVYLKPLTGNLDDSGLNLVSWLAARRDGSGPGCVAPADSTLKVPVLQCDDSAPNAMTEDSYNTGFYRARVVGIARFTLDPGKTLDATHIPLLYAGPEDNPSASAVLFK